MPDCEKAADTRPSDYEARIFDFWQCYAQSMSRTLLEDDTVEALLVPRSGLLLLHAVGVANARNTALAAGNARAGTGHADVEVHTKDTDTGVVLDTHVNVLGDTKTKVASVREVAAAEFVLLDLETTLNDLLRLGATDSDVASDLLVTADTKATKSWLVITHCSVPWWSRESDQ